MKLRDWLKQNKSIFSESDARFLIETLLETEIAFLLSNDTYLDEQKLEYLERAKEIYGQGMPLAYIVNKECFYGQEFKVDKNCLIPRKETELVVSKSLELINDKGLRSVLDLCCGCGNIAISLKMNTKGLSVTASDISSAALGVCRRNINSYNLSIDLIRSDLFAGFKNKSFDLVVSNPPYVEAKNIKGSLKFEPKEALWGDCDGLYYIKKILKKAKNYLNNNGYLVIEVGAGQRQLIEKLDSFKAYKLIEWVQDYSGHDRAIVLNNG